MFPGSVKITVNSDQKKETIIDIVDREEFNTLNPTVTLSAIREWLR